METVHLMVIKGEDTGKAITVPPAGARVGRSNKNDIVLSDPSLSRHHCRLYFKPEGTLCVADLGSSNQTLVNNVPVTETDLRIGDLVVIGNDEMKVVETRRADLIASAPQPAQPQSVDLGFSKEAPETDAKRRSRLYFLIGLLGVTTVAAGIAIQWSYSARKAQGKRPARVAPAAPKELSLEFDYEKVQADTNNIFRYRLTLAGGKLNAQIDDLQNNRHVQPREFAMDKANMQAIAKFIEESEFFSLEPEYRGSQPDSLDSFDILIILGRRAHRVRIVNRIEPDGFRAVREKLEDIGKNLLGTWAIGYSPEKLLQLANDAYLTGRKLCDEREVRYGNIWNAIRSFKEAEWYLETVDRKPDFYPDIVHQINVCMKELDRRYEDTNFRAQKAIRLRDWGEAAKELRVICEMVPAREDKRHAQARRDLLEVENQMRIQR
jgi:pSer/pThr/pTyr-binding forkhead associated (FHA) protein